MSSLKKFNAEKVDLKELQNKIVHEMEQRQWKYATLAKVTGVSAGTIRSLCVGEDINPTISTLEAIAKVFDMDIFELIGSKKNIKIIDQGTIPVYSPSEIDLIEDFSAAREYVICYIQEGGDSFAVRCDNVLSNKLINNNIVIVDEGDYIVFSKDISTRAIRNRSLVIVEYSNEVFFAEILKIDDDVSLLSKIDNFSRHGEILRVPLKNIIAVMVSIQLNHS